MNDPNDGPFASLWKKDTTESGGGDGGGSSSYQWDGIHGVKEFWNQLDNKYTTTNTNSNDDDDDDGEEKTKNVEFWQATSM